MTARHYGFPGVVLTLALSAPAFSTPALADPVGTYDLVGINPDNGGEYSGTVTVSRNGETYTVVWTIGGAESTGVGLGSKRGSSTTGAASTEDDTLAIGYGNGDGFGIATYELQPDGSWKGYWAYSGGEKVSTETWTRPGGAKTRSLELPATPTSNAMKPMSNSAARP
ncbi:MULTISPECIES: hypothetical protein [unclassified Rhizobium]|uniref:hypothetical protein n=1 Tax=unclassified Rhizobium TaxID=2613769 RepID=UPI000B1F627C|nr:MULTISPECIES: hypothetical protein [unclassified Rhizobium]